MDNPHTQGSYLHSQQYDQMLMLLNDLPDSPCVLRLQCEILGHPSFFPGGRGYCGPTFPVAPVLFIGHNFDTDTGFRQSVERGHEDLSMPTWRNLVEHFLPEAELPIEACFFTNVYLGAIVHPPAKPKGKQKTTNRGTFKCSSLYRSACIRAAQAQVRIVRPSVIALLGRVVPRRFQEAFPVFKHLPVQPVGGQRLQLFPDLAVRVIELVHPSNPRSNESHREQGRKLRAAIAAA
jgi:hypothetical protein